MSAKWQWSFYYHITQLLQSTYQNRSKWNSPKNPTYKNFGNLNQCDVGIFKYGGFQNVSLSLTTYLLRCLPFVDRCKVGILLIICKKDSTKRLLWKMPFFVCYYSIIILSQSDSIFLRICLILSQLQFKCLLLRSILLGLR